MASKNDNMSPDAPLMQLSQLKETKKQFAKEQKQQKKEAKQRAKELEQQQREIDEQLDGSSLPVVLVTLFIIIIWLGILVLLIKMDVGGFGRSVLTPIFKDVPVINKILPTDDTTETNDLNAYGGYQSIKEAVEQIRVLELQLEQIQNSNATYVEQIETLKTEVERLKTFEDNQVNFQKIKEEFYEDVVYAENGPGAEEYRKYYEEMDPATAEALYKQVIGTENQDKAKIDYARTFSNMDAKSAAKILETMTDNLDLAAQILETLDASSRGQILGEMDPNVAARITKLMAPES